MHDDYLAIRMKVPRRRQAICLVFVQAYFFLQTGYCSAKGADSLLVFYLLLTVGQLPHRPTPIFSLFLCSKIYKRHDLPAKQVD